jgi:hypothetical protein
MSSLRFGRFGMAALIIGCALLISAADLSAQFQAPGRPRGPRSGEYREAASQGTVRSDGSLAALLRGRAL